MLNILLFSTQDLLFFSLVIATIIGTIIGFSLLYRKSDKLSKQFFVSFFKRRFLHLLASFIILFFVIFSSLLFLQYREKLAREPIKVVTASELKNQYSQELSLLANKGLGYSDKAGVYLLDIRSRDDYNLEHLKGSSSKPAEKAVKNVYPQKNQLVIVARESEMKTAREVAEAIKAKEGGSPVVGGKSFGKIYIITDGYEGLKKAGLETEVGIWD